MEDTILQLPRLIKDRTINEKYLVNNEIRIWTGKKLYCKHNQPKWRCKICTPSSHCVHNIFIKSCRICTPSILCEHNILLNDCKKCCNQDKLCEHGNHKSKCKQCGGGSFCEHNKERYRCEKCNPEGHLISNMRARMSMALKREYKSESTIELLGCNMEHFLQYLQKQFDDNMTFENYGDYWHLDHIKPCASFDLKNQEQQKKCFHYTNLQPLEGKENMSKGSKYDEETFNRYWKNDIEGWIDK